MRRPRQKMGEDRGPRARRRRTQRKAGRGGILASLAGLGTAPIHHGQTIVGPRLATTRWPTMGLQAVGCGPRPKRQGVMKRPLTSKKPRDLAAAFREVKRLRAEVAKAERSTERQKRSDALPVGNDPEVEGEEPRS